MNNRLDISATEPRQESYPSDEQRFTIAFWMMKYETFIFNTRPYATYERCTRAFDKLFAHFPDKRFLHEFRRADLEDFKQRRLEAGVSPKTVNIERSCIRWFWNFLIKMDADGVAFNATVGVRVKMPSKKSPPGERLAKDQNDARILREGVLNMEAE